MKIREPQIRAEVAMEARRTGKDRGCVRDRVLRRHMLCGLSDVEVEPSGRRLPPNGETVRDVRTATPLPNDTCPDVVEMVGRTYSDVGDSVLLLFGRSPAPTRVLKQMERLPLLVDPYVCTHSGDGSTAVWEPSVAVDVWQQQRGARGPVTNPLRDLRRSPSPRQPFQFLYLHAPAPGIIDRYDFLSPGPAEPPVSAVDWRQLTHRQYGDLVGELVRFWLPFCADTVSIAVQTTTVVFDADGSRGGRRKAGPLVARALAQLGFNLVRQHPVEIQPGDVPIDDPALQRQSLRIYQRRAG